MSGKIAVDKYHKAHRLRIEKNYVRFIIQQTTGDHVTYQRTNNYKLPYRWPSERASNRRT